MGVGRAIISLLDRVRGLPARRPENDLAFTMAVVGLGAKLAKADGVVTVEEWDAFTRVFRAPPDAEAQVARVFMLARQSTRGYQSYARQIARRWSHEPAVLENVLDGLFYIAASDGRITGAELDYLREVADAFNVDPICFQRLHAQWSPEPENPYRVLGVNPGADPEEIRRAYRQLARDHHPDKFTGRGMPHSAEMLAHAKMAAINAAYAQLMKSRSPVSMAG